jgi:hypothetical protein
MLYYASTNQNKAAVAYINFRQMIFYSTLEDSSHASQTLSSKRNIWHKSVFVHVDCFLLFSSKSSEIDESRQELASFRHWCLTPVILATQEAEITLHKNKAGGVAQSEGPEFKPQYRLQKVFFTRQWEPAKTTKLPS